MAWVLLIIAGLFEIGWAIGLKYADGFTRPVPSALTVAAMIVSMYLLAQSARHIPIGTAYAVWTGIGAVGTAALGMWLFDEPRTFGRAACLVLVIGGIFGLKYFSGSASAGAP